MLRGEITIAEAARREGVSQTSIANWRDLFLEAGGAAIQAGATIRPTSREQQLAAEIEQLTSALGEAHMELRLWRKGGGSLPGFGELEQARVDAEMTVVSKIARPT